MYAGEDANASRSLGDKIRRHGRLNVCEERSIGAGRAGVTGGGSCCWRAVGGERLDLLARNSANLAERSGFEPVLVVSAAGILASSMKFEMIS